MTIQIDFLPPAYRARQLQQQQRRQQAWLAVPVALGLLATDAVLVHRVKVAAAMADNARSHAEQQEQRAEQRRQLATRLSERQREIEASVQPMQMPRLSAAIDAMLMATPDAIALQEVHCRHTPWQPTAVGSMRLVASCPGADQLEQYLVDLGGDHLLPPLQCTRTFRGPVGLGFELESINPASSPR